MDENLRNVTPVIHDCPGAGAGTPEEDEEDEEDEDEEDKEDEDEEDKEDEKTKMTIGSHKPTALMWHLAHQSTNTRPRSRMEKTTSCQI
jgi:TATA-binding protein-associated factor Taf7